jgi:hypothetical protein
MEDHIKMLEDRKDAFIANVRTLLLSGFIGATAAVHNASSHEALEEALDFVQKFITNAKNNTHNLQPWEHIGYQYVIGYMEAEFTSLFWKLHGVDRDEDGDHVLAALDLAMLTNSAAFFDTPSDTSDSFEAF